MPATVLYGDRQPYGDRRLYGAAARCGVAARFGAAAPRLRASHQRTNPAFPIDVYNMDKEYTRMRTNIVIDDQLMRDTLEATGLQTKREAVEEALRTLLRLSKQAEIRKLRGKLDWHGNLDAMRTDR